MTFGIEILKKVSKKQNIEKSKTQVSTMGLTILLACLDLHTKKLHDVGISYMSTMDQLTTMGCTTLIRSRVGPTKLFQPSSN